MDEKYRCDGALVPSQGENVFIERHGRGVLIARHQCNPWCRGCTATIRKKTQANHKSDDVLGAVKLVTYSSVK